MKKKMVQVLFLFVIGGLMSFSRDSDWENFTAYAPLIMAQDDLVKSISNQPPRDFEAPGKIYLYGDNIYIVDKFRGVHVIDNTNPRIPKKIGFIKIPGAMDVAIRDSVLYVDNAIDLVGLDIRNYPDITETDRLNSVFPEPTPPDLGFIPRRFSRHNRPENTVIVGWF